MGVLGYIVLSSQQPKFETAIPEPPAYLVRVAIAARKPVIFQIHSQGTVAPKTRTNIVAEVSGPITSISPQFLPGGFFSKGDILVRIDPRNYETAIHRAKLNVARAHTRVMTEQALSGYALEDWVTLQELNEEDELPSDLTLRKPQYAEVLAEQAAAKAELTQAEGNLVRTEVQAPYQGLVLEKNVDVGQFVNVGTVLARAVAVDSAEVRLPLKLQDLEFVDLPDRQNSDAVKVTLRATIGGKVSTWDALIVRTEGVIDLQARVLYAVAMVEDPYGFEDSESDVLRFGTFVHATIEGRNAGELFVVPRHAIDRNDKIWVVTAENTIQPRTVSIVRLDEDHAYVDAGLVDGDRYCITPIDRPLPGMKVRVSD